VQRLGRHVSSGLFRSPEAARHWPKYVARAMEGLTIIQGDCMRCRAEQFFTGGFFFGKVNTQEIEGRLNELAEMGWRVVSTSTMHRFFGESHYMTVILSKE